MRTMNDSLEETGTKDHPTGSKKLDVEAIEDPKLVNTVESRLANLAEITGRVPGENPAALNVDDDDSTLDDTDVEDVNKDDKQAVSDDDDIDSTPEPKEVDATKSKDAVEIPEAYVRAAIHNGWKQEDIEAFAEANPEVANKTFENLYNSTNKASREWAAIGRAAREQVIDGSAPAKSAEADKLEYGGVDIATLKKEFDIDPAIERMLENSNARDKKLTDAINTLVTSKTAQPQDASRVDRAAKSYDAATEAAQEQQINGFFAADSMASYKEFYGDLRFGETWEQLPPGQARNRYAVYQTADQLLAGSTMQSHPMSLTEALERAHLLVTDGMREEVIRSDIKKTATKRKKSLMFRPSEGRGKQSGGGGKPKTKNDLEHKVEGLIKKALSK